MADDRTRSSWQALLHYWFVEYNPLYLVSAALVLVGVNVLSADLTKKAFLVGQLGVPAIAEVYAWALIGSAGLLIRLGLQRPAVMLALLAAFYQCDLTMHTETCVYLGWVGSLAAGVWWLSFVGKLLALGWAMRLQLSRTAIAVPSFAALGLVVIPRYLPTLDRQQAGLLVGGWVFAVLASAIWTSRGVRSVASLDAWGATVARRSVRATWTMWGVLFVAHALFWCSDHGIAALALIPAGLMLATRVVRREGWTWVIVVATVVVVAVWLPPLLSFTSLLGALVLALRALRGPVREQRAPESRASGPYRKPKAVGPRPRARVHVSFSAASGASRIRLLSGALLAMHLAAWTAGWSGGPWPEHVLALDLTLTVFALLVAWKARVYPLVFVAALVHGHDAAVRGIIGPPSGGLEWGGLMVVGGFTILIASVAWSYLSRRRRGRSLSSGGGVTRLEAQDQVGGVGG